MKIRLVTLNAGLLSMFGGRIKPAPFLEERLLELPRTLTALNAPIIAVQEIYEARHQRYLADKMRATHPFTFAPQDWRPWAAGSGLMVLSAYPIETRFEKFHACPWDERIFVAKGILAATCTLKSGGQISLLNLHTTAGGAWKHPEDPDVDKIRALQINQALKAAQGRNHPCIILGDINAGPGVSENNFRQFANAGYESIYDLLASGDPSATWDPVNPLNAEGPHKHCHAQRIDHAFILQDDRTKKRILPLSCHICCSEPTVMSPQGLVTVSDHYGLVFELELAAAAG